MPWLSLPHRALLMLLSPSWPQSYFLVLLQDFVVSLSIILRGSVTDKLNWAFNLYDLNKDGCITREVLQPSSLPLCACMKAVSRVVLAALADFWFVLISGPPLRLSRRWRISCTPSMTWWGSTPTPTCGTVLPRSTLTTSSRYNSQIIKPVHILQH